MGIDAEITGRGLVGEWLEMRGRLRAKSVEKAEHGLMMIRR
jgi:hypothetical protein